MTVPGEPARVGRGRFVTIEGGEGVGKSTQLRRLAASLRSRGLEVVETREPGGSPGAELIRGLLVRGHADRWDPMAETLLLAAARRDHVLRTIRPALDRGAWVLCDRFTDSTRAYQGAALGVSAEAVEATIALATGGLVPDLTLILDLPPETGMARALARPGGAQRYEAMPAALHARVRAAFLAIAAAEPGRCVVVSAEGEEETVAARLLTALDAALSA